MILLHPISGCSMMITSTGASAVRMKYPLTITSGLKILICPLMKRPG